MSDVNPSKGLDFNDADRDLLDELLLEEGVGASRPQQSIQPRASGARTPARSRMVGPTMAPVRRRAISSPAPSGTPSQT